MNNANKALLKALADRRRRYVLSALGEHDQGMSERDLAATVAAAERDTSQDDLTDGECERVLASLRHVHLPKLEEGELIERDERGLLSTIDSSMPENEPLGRFVQSPETVSEKQEAIFASVAHERRQHIISVFRKSDRVLSLEELGKEVTAREQDKPASELDDEAVNGTVRTLHHTHLQKLVDVGLLEYDTDDRSVQRGASFDDCLLSDESALDGFLVIPLQNDSGRQQVSLT